ncbi:MAG: hypothetical protein ACYC96_05590 [Fimbriimonadaceae bacterium]
MKTIKPSLTIMLAVAAPLLFGGCSQSGNAFAPSAADQKTSSRLDSIRKSSGGDWAKVSADDKKYLIDTLGHGSEYTAKMVFGVKAGPPPTPGIKKPGGPGG